MQLATVVLLLVVCCQSALGDRYDDSDNNRTIVDSLYGPVRGRVRVADNGAEVYEYLGMPYARPPVGELRFKKAQEPGNYKNFGKPPCKTREECREYRFAPKKIYEADKMKPACPQYSDIPYPWYDSDPGQSEDCLYMNIWVPALANKENRTDPNCKGRCRPVKRPVKIYVHGGGWFEGGSSRMGYYDGFGEAVDTYYENGTSKADGVVVVTFNYRLGALGFLTVGTDEAPGNAGLTDIYNAFYLVTDTIYLFGGDDGPKSYYDGPSNTLTLVGEGTGAILANLIKSWNHGVHNSMTLLTLKALPGVDAQGNAYDNNLKLTDRLAQSVGCNTTVKDDPKATAECLRAVDALELMKAANQLQAAGRGPPNVFMPQTNGSDKFFFYKRNPYMGLHLLNYTNQWNNVATFTGDEGHVTLAMAFPEVFGTRGAKGDGVRLSAACAKKMARKVLSKYTPCMVDQLLGKLDPGPSSCNVQKVARAIGDAYFICPMVFYAEELRRTKEGSPPAYKFYLLQKKISPPYNPWPAWMGSVSFGNVQVDHIHEDRKLHLNGSTYDYTDEQMEQARVNKELVDSVITTWPPKEVALAEFTTEAGAYSVLELDGTLTTEGKSKLHARNCDLLRPHFQYTPHKDAPSFN